MTHTAGLSVLPFTALPAWGAVLIACAGLSGLWWYWPRHVNRQHPHAITIFTWKAGVDCVVMQTDGNVSSCTLASRAFVMPWLVILYFRQGRRWRSLFILPDMLPRETFRRLRVRLRTEIHQSGKFTRAC